MSLRFGLRAFITAAVMVAASATAITIGATPAHADSCYTWTRNLSSGSSGEDVRQLQIRIAGWSGYQSHLGLDGSFGPATTAALKRFQSAYGLVSDGVAGPATYSRIYSLQDADCTPIHFSYAELNHCNADWSGGAVSAATAKRNALWAMWKLEALRHALGDHPLSVASGFRSYACNSAVGGATNSRHLYGDGVDLVSSYASLCTISKQSRYHGFSGLFGPGYPGHNDHVHLDSRADFGGSYAWSAPTCGI